MKITFLLPHATIAGGIRVAAIYARKFTDMGHEVTVISRQPPKATWRTLLKQRFHRTFGVARRRGRPATTQLDFLGKRHIRIRKRLPFDVDDIPDGDIIIATWWETAFVVSELPPRKGRKFYLVQHHEVHDYLPHHLSHGSYYLPLKKIVISRWLQEIMEYTYGDRTSALIPNSVDPEQFHAPEREKRPVPTVGLLYASNPFKGLDVALKAIERARLRVPELKIVALSAKPEDPAAPLPAGSSYHLCPPQDSIREIYASCDVWIMPSNSEGFGLPLLEAMACRTPVVSTRTGAAEDVIREGVNGHIVEIGDHEALGDRLADVLQASPERWKAMSDAAYAQARSYSWDEAARRFLNILEARNETGFPTHPAAAK